MSLSPYEKKVIEARFSESERRREKRRNFEAKVLEPIWWIGMTSGYIVSATKFLVWIPVLRVMALFVFLSSLIVYIGLWKAPMNVMNQAYERGLVAHLRKIQSEHRVIKAIALILVVQISHLINLTIYRMLTA